MLLFHFFLQYYTVVRNVKKAYQIQESGEFQEFNDDVEYILDALQDNNPIATRWDSPLDTLDYQISKRVKKL